jgi:protein-S-isoprenylcysteine O-methyltransferase Ste14
MMLWPTTRSTGKSRTACDFVLRLQTGFSWPHQGSAASPVAVADTADNANVIVRPPIAWALAVLAGLVLNWLMPLPFLPAAVSAGWLGAIVFVLALALVAWAISTMTRAGSNVPTNLPTTTIVEAGPYRLTRNSIYLGMVLGLIDLAIAFNSLWLLMTLALFALVIRYGVITR